MKSTSKMYLTQAEADAMGLPSAQEQVDRYNRAIRSARVETPSGMVLVNGRWWPVNSKVAEGKKV